MSRRIGWWIFGTVVLINGLVLVFAGAEHRQNKEEYELRAELLTQNLAQAIDQSISTKIEKIDLFLHMVAQELERQLSTGGINKELIQSLFGKQNKYLYEASAIRISDSEGNLILDGDGESPQRSYAEREFFAYLREHPGSSLFVSKPVKGYLTGRWIVPFALAYHRPDGAFAGVVGVGVQIESFSDLLSRFDAGERGLITLRDSDLGVIASRLSGSSGRLPVGDRNVSQSLIKRVASGARQASFRAAPPFDGYRRTVTLRKLERAPMYVLVGLDESNYLAPWYREMPSKASYLAIFFLLTSLSAWALWRIWLRQAKSTEALRAAHEQLARVASVVEGSADAILMRSLDYKTLIWNSAAERMFGYTAAERIGKTSRFLVPPEFRAEVDRAHEILDDGRLVPACDTVRLTKDGRRIDVSVSRFPVKDANGRLIGASFVYRDITERKRAEEALRKARDELERRVIERTEQLRHLAVAATLTEETERRSIARDLHDGLGQTLHVIRLKLARSPPN
ncbi:MAG: PAS domain S-box protein [Betaproteobacteria bacterium]|nr:PAS domain S-box protein [Betaproteobacteria bacterium]